LIDRHRRRRVEQEPLPRRPVAAAVIRLPVVKVHGKVDAVTLVRHSPDKGEQRYESAIGIRAARRLEQDSAFDVLRGREAHSNLKCNT